MHLRGHAHMCAFRSARTNSATLRLTGAPQFDRRSPLWTRLLLFVPQVDFEVLLKVDDDAVVHVSRLWQWLLRRERRLWRALYAGAVQSDADVVRMEDESKPLEHRRKWHVSRSAYPDQKYPPYALGGGYMLGARSLAAVLRNFERWMAIKNETVPIEVRVALLSCGSPSHPKSGCSCLTC